ncbi:hypothetical protein ACLI4R_10495 [Natrialbaceae archaeon A-chndr2]
MRKRNDSDENCEDYERVQNVKQTTVEIEQPVLEIIEKSLELGDQGLITPVERKSIECGDIAIWKSPASGERYCEYNAAKHFE